MQWGDLLDWGLQRGYIEADNGVKYWRPGNQGCRVRMADGVTVEAFRDAYLFSRALARAT